MADAKHMDAYQVQGEFHRDAMIGRLTELARDSSFEQLETVILAFEHWASEADAQLPTLSVVLDHRRPSRRGTMRINGG